MSQRENKYLKESFLSKRIKSKGALIDRRTDDPRGRFRSLKISIYANIEWKFRKNIFLILLYEVELKFLLTFISR